MDETPQLAKGAAKAMYELYDVVTHNLLSSELGVRMHYGHHDVFDRIFHISRGGISKASRVINISEDIYAGFNSIETG
ncbi:putative 1,3-beta-glucan synthase [Helianthus annuus]|uniref:1,3-beta-glucan synthase n=1 Tax=Helianthus annuus TaxID=4232 RepID=A0A9K3IU68_HELAN|nr:putative 1,3-beta-glucan synthase [Helianthus annuus]KAJ0560913.1 putative 1,3-beta-glucan synthase [Helianthus annuus]KAJ0567396.1 putative 1,3-beta-glucan synthase [Helianthus annuus]KAJ0573954.1 putative 1,3-beta-glucan synthase [Helianthus annuus]KAJ0738287.1 putative 1,3-beta-glucan synthase [Helianthus annuus]